MIGSASRVAAGHEMQAAREGVREERSGGDGVEGRGREPGRKARAG